MLYKIDNPIYYHPALDKVTKYLSTRTRNWLGDETNFTKVRGSNSEITTLRDYLSVSRIIFLIEYTIKDKKQII